MRCASCRNTGRFYPAEGGDPIPCEACAPLSHDPYAALTDAELVETAGGVLRGARELIARPGGWTQRAAARSAKGRCVQSVSPRAVCWCASGAAFRVAVGARAWADDFSLALGALAAAAKERGFDSFIEYNDAPGRTQAEVVALYDTAIAKLEATR